MGWGSSFWFPHTVVVRDVSASGGMGSTLGPRRELRAEVKDEQQLVRTADGAQSVSSSTVTVPLDSAVRAGAKVTVWPGTESEREAVVLAVSRQENPPPLSSHLVLSLK
ncbi:hypothetical protein C5B92_07075 [Rathayibacter sp. AY1A4]|uniref:hypothetical protein n=1 Tax=Rathayibacter sp. AY1A4 TaxID=2080522 RepID=UPI000CE7F730|nr:hypothetical protein [Rathayibacter sp. AY1A4]PPF18270.1 hypothetical protein C5B92_07075 [Rathayibacter sp. AY1A4]